VLQIDDHLSEVFLSGKKLPQSKNITKRFAKFFVFQIEEVPGFEADFDQVRMRNLPVAFVWSKTPFRAKLLAQLFNVFECPLFYGLNPLRWQLP
jgi:hypothetical protein